MIVKLRANAGIYMSVGLILGGWTLAAAATQPVTRSEMSSFVYSTLAVAGLAVVGGMAGVIALLLRNDRAHYAALLAADRQNAAESREQIIKSFDRLIDSVNAGAKALTTHNDSGDAHPVAMRLHLSPVHEKLETLDMKVMRLEFITEEGRDPKDSPIKRRSYDPENDDHSKDRGKKR